MPRIESLPPNAPLLREVVGRKPPTKRVWYTFDLQSTRCLVVGEDGTLSEKLSTHDLNMVRAGEPSPLRDKGCYALYSAGNHSVKIGQSGDVAARWFSIEAAAGTYMQPLMMWQSDTPKLLERMLHNRFADVRGIGEWFAADYVLPYLENVVTPEVLTNGWRGARPDTEFVTPQQLSCWINVGVDVLSKWRHSQRGPTYFAVNGSLSEIRYRVSDVDEWLESRPLGPQNDLVEVSA